MAEQMVPLEEYQVEEFRYPLWLRMPIGVLLIFFILMWACTFCFFALFIWNNWELYADFAELQKLIGNLILLVLGTIFMIVIAVTQFIQQPHIRGRDDGFQLSTLIYHSKWLRWDDIKKIKKLHSLSTKWYHIYAVILKGTEISPLYSLLTFTWVLDGYRAFILTNKIGNYDRFIALMREKRPDLFTEWE